MEYRKLVRDRIPEHIKASGSVPVYHTLQPEAFIRELRRKLTEEVQEYLADSSSKAGAAELVDILEVVYALAELDSVTPELLERLRQKKNQERGGFTQRIYLESVLDW